MRGIDPQQSDPVSASFGPQVASSCVYANAIALYKRNPARCTFGFLQLNSTARVNSQFLQWKYGAPAPRLSGYVQLLVARTARAEGSSAARGAGDDGRDSGANVAAV